MHAEALRAALHAGDVAPAPSFFRTLHLVQAGRRTDTDGDTVPDNVDGLPTVPGVTSGFLEDGLRDICEYSSGFGNEHFAAPNNNATKGRRNALCNKLNSAAKSVAKGKYQEA